MSSSKSGRSGPDGWWLLACLYVALLAGRFDVGRVVPLLSGIDLRWILLVALSVIFAAWAAQPSRVRLHAPPASESMLLLAWVLWLVLTGMWSASEADVAGEVENLLLIVAYTFLARGIATRLSPDAAVPLEHFVLIVGYVYLLGGLAGGVSSIGRMSAFGGGPNVFVRVVALGAISALALFAVKGKVAYLAAAIPLLGGALLSGSRGGVVAAIAVVLGAAVVITVRVGLARATTGALVAAAAGVLAWRMLPDGSVDYLERRFIEQTLEQRYSSGRDSLYEFGLAMFWNNPVGGAGVGTFAAQYRPGEAGYHAHNLLLSTAAEGGLIGIALLLAALAVPTWRILSSRPLPTGASFMLLCAVYVFIASQFSGDYYDSRLMWFFLVLAQAWSAGAPKQLSDIRDDFLASGRL